MAIQFIGGDIGGGNLATVTDVVWPGSLNADDVAILTWTFGSARTQTTPTGFTLVADNDTTSGSGTGALYRKTLTGSETGSLSLICDAINKQTAVLLVYRGVDPTTPIGGTVVFDNTHVAGTTHNNPTYTTAVVDEAVITTIHERESTNIDTLFTAPTDYTKRGDTINTTSGTGATTCAVADDGLGVSRAASTAVTPGVWTGNNATGTANVITYTFGLRPAATAFTGHKIASGSTWVDAALFASVGTSWS
jgi:hypothetical protein